MTDMNECVAAYVLPFWVTFDAYKRCSAPRELGDMIWIDIGISHLAFPYIDTHEAQHFGMSKYHISTSKPP